ncbi:histidine phosphotransferase family protein [Kordiimonas pumila]|uniref:Histidine phosphotransferase family protein n=1 Tax=Kordiimonas pumila TaxID=2161677 RepID=A0ABV7D7Z1_9PROT|nr:histidine phosphotransferase family protein [Kordiimonas pumila]
MSDLDFASLLCSRLCHDLVSPVGAINNGLEILAEEKDPAMRDAVLDLIDKSTRQTVNKLQFFRLAFGAAGGFSAQLDMREAEKATRALISGSRIEMDWQVSVPSASKSVVKLLLNLCLVVSETLIRGGKITVQLDEADEAINISVLASGARIIFPENIRATLTAGNAMDELEPRTAPAHLASLLVRELGGHLELDFTEGEQIAVHASLLKKAL